MVSLYMMVENPLFQLIIVHGVEGTSSNVINKRENMVSAPNRGAIVSPSAPSKPGGGGGGGRAVMVTR